MRLRITPGAGVFAAVDIAASRFSYRDDHRGDFRPGSIVPPRRKGWGRSPGALSRSRTSRTSDRSVSAPRWIMLGRIRAAESAGQRPCASFRAPTAPLEYCELVAQDEDLDVFGVSDRVRSTIQLEAWRRRGRSAVAPPVDHAGRRLAAKQQVKGCVHSFGHPQAWSRRSWRRPVRRAITPRCSPATAWRRCWRAPSAPSDEPRWDCCRWASPGTRPSRCTRCSVVIMVLFWRLTPAAELNGDLTVLPEPSRPPGRGRPPSPLVCTLAGLFAIDAFAGGLAVQAVLALWFQQRFGVADTQLVSCLGPVGLQGSRRTAPGSDQGRAPQCQSKRRAGIRSAGRRPNRGHDQGCRYSQSLRLKTM